MSIDQLTVCPKCLKIQPLCICSEIKAVETTHSVLILQHPQEPDQELGTARIANLALPKSTLKIGLSWRNLSSALGREAVAQKWAVLYLGSGIAGSKAARPGPHSGSGDERARLAASGNRGLSPSKALGGANEPTLTLVSKQGAPLPDQNQILPTLEGLVVLDGTWSQAKTLWWRNAWLLKLRRAILTPASPSLYRELRREPRRECLSTIESIGQTLVAMGEPVTVNANLNDLFQTLIDRKRAHASGKRGRQSPPPAVL